MYAKNKNKKIRARPAAYYHNILLFKWEKLLTIHNTHVEFARPCPCVGHFCSETLSNKTLSSRGRKTSSTSLEYNTRGGAKTNNTVRLYSATALAYIPGWFYIFRLTNGFHPSSSSWPVGNVSIWKLEEFKMYISLTLSYYCIIQTMNWVKKTLFSLKCTFRTSEINKSKQSPPTGPRCHQDSRRISILLIYWSIIYLY